MPARPRSAAASACPSIARALPPMAPSTRPTPTSAMARVHLGAGRRTSTPARAHPERPLRPRRRSVRARARRAKRDREPLRISEAQVKRLEEEIDEMNAELRPLALVRAAGRLAGGGGAARGAHRVPPRRAPDGRACGGSPTSPSARRRSSTSIACPTFCSSPAATSTTAARATCFGSPGRTGSLERLRLCSNSEASRQCSFPSRDDNSLKSIPFQYVTVSLIALNVLVFMLEVRGLDQSAVSELRRHAQRAVRRDVLVGPAHGPLPTAVAVRRRARRCSPTCSSTPTSFTWSSTCCSSGCSATTSRTPWGTCGSCSSISLCGVFAGLFHSLDAARLRAAAHRRQRRRRRRDRGLPDAASARRRLGAGVQAHPAAHLGRPGCSASGSRRRS